MGTQFAAAPAQADTAPPVGTPTTVSADSLPTVQQNGVVWAEVTVGNTVYATGSFSETYPAGTTNTAANDTPRSNLLAFNITTGNLITSFNHALNGQGLTITSSPDGSRVYVGGDFTTVDGITRNHIAAFDTATGALDTSFVPSIPNEVDAIAVNATGSTVYVGGNFFSVNGKTRTRLAAVTASGVLTSWAPTADDNMVTALVVTPDQSEVVIGGRFDSLNGVSTPGLGAVTTANGSAVPYAINQYVQDYSVGSNGSGITTLSTDGTQVYGSGFSFAAGNFEGTFGVDPDTGKINFLNDCHGDTYSDFAVGQVLYSASHVHDCTAVGSFPDTSPRINHHATAFTTYPTGTDVGPDSYGWNYNGLPDSQLLDWFPTFTIGSVTGQAQATWSVSGNSNYITYGGEFPSVNGVAQAGLSRFALPSIAPDKSGPIPSASSLTPTGTSFSAGTIRATWTATWDMDNANLTYNLFRDGGSTPIYSVTQASNFWTLPKMGFIDTGLKPGSTHTYKLQVVDPNGNKVGGNTSAVITVSSSTATTSPYVTDVTSDGASDLWRLNEASGTTGYDSIGFNDLTEGAGVTDAVATDPLTNETGSAAASFNGTSTGAASTTAAITGPNTFSVEGWFQTTSTSGGKIIGFGNATEGNSSSNYDRQVYLDNAGHLIFGVYNNGTNTITSTRTYNDGTWHHVVAELSSAGMAMYVDGKVVGQNQNTTIGQSYTGYWRIGGDNLGGWPNQPSSNYLAGNIADVAVYPTALTVSKAIQHYTDAGYASPVQPAPTDSYGKAVYNDNPLIYWRLNDATGSAAAVDTSLNADNGTVNSGVTLQQPSPVTGSSGTAAAFNGSNGLVVSSQVFNNPTTYSEELWFNTTTTSGGKLIGFGDQPSGNSSSYDRHVYMLDTGQLEFGTYTGQLNTVVSPSSYNNGQWHHLVATQGPNGMALYVDGQLVGTNPQTQAQSYSGYWRVGGDNTWGGADSNYFAGTIDEVAIYGTALSASQVLSHYEASPAAFNPPPTATIATPTCTYLACTFDGTGSTDPDGKVTGYSWTFSDGGTASTATPSHTFAAAGTYQVGLTVTDSFGNTATTTTSVTVSAAPAPTAAIATPSCTYLACTFDGSGSVANAGTITGYSWDFGDAGTSTSATPSHTFSSPGTYGVTLTVTDSNGNTSAATTSVTVSAAPAPTAAIATPSCTYLACTFDGTGSVANAGTITGYAWTFGDGATSTSATPSHTYGAAGAETVQLTVTNSVGGTASTSVTLSPVAPPAPTAKIATPSCTNLACSFDGSGSVPNAGTITSYAWTFGDGGTSTSATPSHTYGAAGAETVQLTVTNSYGVSATSSVSIAPTSPAGPPVAAFSATCPSLSCSFDASKTTDPGNLAITTYAWTFGDGNTGTGVGPTNVYPAAGVYTVTLTVTDAGGQTNSVTHTVSPAPTGNPTIKVYASDSFSRTVTGGWGSATTGGAWSPTGSGTNLSVSGGVGSLKMTAPGSQPGAYLGGVSSTDASVQTTFTTTAAATGSGIYVDLIGRRVNSNTYYYGRTLLGSNGSVGIALLAVDKGTTTTVKSTYTLPGVTYTPGMQLNVELQVTGTGPTTLRMKAWPTTAAQPTTWQLSATSTIADLQVAGSVGVSSYLTGSSTTSPVTTQYTSFTAGPTQGLPTAVMSATCSGLKCSTSASNSTDPSGTISSYKWSWGDGVVTTGVTSSHTYAGAGTYTVTLTVTNPSGWTSVTTKQVTVPA